MNPSRPASATWQRCGEGRATSRHFGMISPCPGTAGQLAHGPRDSLGRRGLDLTLVMLDLRRVQPGGGGWAGLVRDNAARGGSLQLDGRHVPELEVLIPESRLRQRQITRYDAVLWLSAGEQQCSSGRSCNCES